MIFSPDKLTHIQQFNHGYHLRSVSGGKFHFLSSSPGLPIGHCYSVTPFHCKLRMSKLESILPPYPLMWLIFFFLHFCIFIILTEAQAIQHLQFLCALLLFLPMSPKIPYFPNLYLLLESTDCFPVPGLLPKTPKQEPLSPASLYVEMHLPTGVILIFLKTTHLDQNKFFSKRMHGFFIACAGETTLETLHNKIKNMRRLLRVFI